MNKLIAGLLIALMGFGNIFPFFKSYTFANNEAIETFFIVTAYYSPLPDQDFYITGDYEKEVILNGEWIRGASWKGVFPGMLAAPKKYNFGTKIELEWIGVWSVEDRGGAIVEAWKRGYEHDRIDVWMGYGEEGLKKALSWGKRKVKWKILSTWETNINLNNIKTLNSALSYAKKSDTSIFFKWIGIESEKEDIIELQKILQKNGYYKWEIDGVYNKEIINSVFSFQVKKGIITSVSDFWAWYWGNKTRKLFLEEINNTPKGVAIKENIKTVKNNQIQDIFTTYISPTSEKEKIILLQKTLKEIGMYEGELNGNYKDIKEILISYQEEKEIISSRNDLAAGFFWPKTRETIKKTYDKYMVKKKEEEAFIRKMEALRVKKEWEAKKIVDDIWNPSFNEVSPEVRNLQKFLKTLGYFEYKDTAIFWDITKKALIEYQIKKGIIESSEVKEAWVYWPETKKEFIKDITTLFVEEELKIDNTLVYNQ